MHGGSPSGTRLPLSTSSRAGVEGDILVFMPGAYEIMRTIDALGDLAAARGWTLLPLYGELPPAEQDRAVRPSAGRKVVVATNVAETSITIEGVRAVIDSGLARIARFDPHRASIPCMSNRSARRQRTSGRASRTHGPWALSPLWTAQEHRGRVVHEVPEIRRIDLAEIF